MTNGVTGGQDGDRVIAATRHAKPILLMLGLILIIAACSGSDQSSEAIKALSPGLRVSSRAEQGVGEASAPSATASEEVPEPYYTPTPDPIRPLPTRDDIPEWYVVQPGDSLNFIAGSYGIGAYQIQVANGLANPNYLAVGQVLWLPTPQPQDPATSFKIIPDSELIYGPASVGFDLQEQVRLWDGALYQYRETIDGKEYSGAEILMKVAAQYSISPRLLLGILEYHSGWLTRPDPPRERSIYPLGYSRAGYEGLYRQLMWAADQLNRGFYLWRARWAGPYVMLDGSVVAPGPGINAGTAALQYLFAQLHPIEVWRGVIDENGFYRVYEILFGNPFKRAQEPLLPPDLAQPWLELPFEPGRVWSFTGGPHSGWGNWAAWAALDFAPPGDALGCVLSNEWVVAVSDGVVVRSGDGEVVLDLDGDGEEATGWVIHYLHIETRDRVEAGTALQAGDRIGHPSCEGGVSSGTHVHISRRYDGVWIAADGEIPFNLSGWISAGLGSPYDGTLTRNGQVLEACACRNPYNQISR